MRSLVNLTKVSFGLIRGKKSDETKEGIIYLSNCFKNEIIDFRTVTKKSLKRRYKIICRPVNTFSLN